jgi:hypothetical protein
MYRHVVWFKEPEDTVTCMSDYRRGLDRWLDLLTAYKHRW